MPIPYPTFCTEIPQTGNLQTDKGRCRSDIRNIVQKKRDRNHRSRMLFKPYSYAGKDSVEVFRIRNSGLLKRKKLANDI